MNVKKFDFSLFLFIAVASILMANMMESAINVYLTDIYNPRYYIYQALLYGLSVFVVIKNRNSIHASSFIWYMWAFSICCFLFSLFRLESSNLRNIISLFFNTFIIPISFLSGRWIGGRLSTVIDRDLYLFLIQIPAISSMIMLRGYLSLGSWFHADVAFFVIVFMPFIFLFKRKWLSTLFSLIYVLFSLTSAKRSILVFVLASLIIYFGYILIFNERNKIKGALSKILVISIALLGFVYIVNQQSEILGHAIERTEMLGGITDDNGRSEIYSRVLQAIINSDSSGFLFGHGQMAVSRDTEMGAHNDFLEIAYDYGIISALLYLVILIHFIIAAFKSFRGHRYEYGMRLSICIASITILGLLNCIVTSTVLEYSMFLALGTSVGLNNYNIR